MPSRLRRFGESAAAALSLAAMLGAAMAQGQSQASFQSPADFEMQCRCGTFSRVESLREPRPQVQVGRPKGSDDPVLEQRLFNFLDVLQGAFLRCYEPAIRRDPALRGRLVVLFTLEPSGSTSSTTVRDEGLGSREVADCVSARFPRNLETLKPSHTLALQVPLEFSSVP